ncbi:heavy-metal-associated domain-containing protein [Streptosporangium sp. CA-135522]|uniref:heavy-metal-associated domain-containing protein n=1 Tax=Streptosporangium sp. CA-135522 TaxID=3240072 RepID=UPI003D90A041
MSTATYKVTGMTCNGCATKVKNQVSTVAGVSSVDVELATGHVTVTAESPIDNAVIMDTIEETGYEVVLV